MRRGFPFLQPLVLTFLICPSILAQAGSANIEVLPNGSQIEFVVITPEGVSITEYQLLRLNEHKDNGEFGTVTGGAFHAKGGATKDLLPFEGQKLASRTFSVTLDGAHGRRVMASSHRGR